MLDPSEFWDGEGEDTPTEEAVPVVAQTASPPSSAQPEKPPAAKKAEPPPPQIRLRPVQPSPPAVPARRPPPEVKIRNSHSVAWLAIASVLAGILLVALTAILLGKLFSSSPRQETSAASPDTSVEVQKEHMISSLEKRQGAQTNKTPIAATASGVLAIDSDPPGAVVYLDGQRRGVTPTRLSDLPTGREITVRLEAEGFRPWEQRLQLETDTPERQLKAGLYPAVECPAGTGWIYIASEPKGAAVELDGKRFPGTTPMIIDSVCAGEKHSLRLQLVGHRPWISEDITVSAGEVLNLNAELAK